MPRRQPHCGCASDDARSERWPVFPRSENFAACVRRFEFPEPSWRWIETRRALPSARSASCPRCQGDLVRRNSKAECTNGSIPSHDSFPPATIGAGPAPVSRAYLLAIAGDASASAEHMRHEWRSDSGGCPRQTFEAPVPPSCGLAGVRRIISASYRIATGFQTFTSVDADTRGGRTPLLPQMTRQKRSSVATSHEPRNSTPCTPSMRFKSATSANALPDGRMRT